MNIDKSGLTVSSPADQDEIQSKTPESSAKNISDNPDKSPHVGEKRWYAPLLSPLWLCLLVALAIRLWLTVRTHGTFDGDEALLGIQAEHILQGERPVYFYGIPYFGSLEAYLVAILFALFGHSVWALRVETTVFCLGLVALTWWLASLLADTARLPFYAKRCFTTIAALVAALPPLYDGIVELRTGGGWIESFVMMLLLLIAAHRLTSRWHEQASNGEMAWRWAGIGFIIGFGMWIYPLVSIAILAAALWITIDRLVEITRLIRSSVPFLAAIGRPLKQLPLVVTAIPACLLGFLPGIIWGAANNWENLTYIFKLGNGWSRERIHTVTQVTKMYGTCVSPRVIGGATPMESDLLAAIHSPLFVAGLCCITVTVALILTSFVWRHPVLLSTQRLATLPAIFGVCSAVLFCLSSASASILISCNADLGGHYAAPLVLSLPFLFATPLTLIGMLFYGKGKHSQDRATNETPLPAVKATSPRRVVVALLVPLALVLSYAGAQATTYGLTNPDLAFQSAYCTIAPANYEPIIDYMQKEQIHYAWSSNLLGYQISFLTNSDIILADPLARIHPSISIDRIPAYTDAVKNANRPSFLVFVKHGDTHPSFLKLLDTEKVTYKYALFPSQPGVDVMVVTPLNRTVSPFESPSFDVFYCDLR
ncbi:MAG TPA: hypothetical protein VFN35_10495 [Ktedonobacteraceae bacterium]|nr:hypothetical protein [Ktedonobacteraceae bacterium]